MCMAGLSLQQRPQLRRRAWVWPRPQNWFCLLIANPALQFLWKEHFRVTHETFEYLCDLVRADLQKQQTRMRAPISVEERVGLALWRLVTGNSYRSCGLQFSALRCVVEGAFVMLKSRWRIVMTKIEQKTSTLTKTVVASYVLHNICIEMY